MGKGRLEAFSDGVIAILITIMILELKVPHGADLEAIRPLLPVFLTYVLSFVYLGIYWNNHHHMLQATTHVTGGALWANQHLLFWLSLVPFTTSWMGENHYESLPTAAYGVVLLCAAIAYTILQTVLVRERTGHNRTLGRAVGSDRKGKLSMLLYAIAVQMAFALPWVSITIYIIVALIWLVPDKRIEHTLTHQGSGTREE
jgi:uncharacterized membrane protein